MTVTRNTVSNSPTANGIDVSDPFGFGPNTAVNISGNNVSGMLNGIAAQAGSLTDTLILSGNTVSNNTNGIHLTGVTASVVGGNDINGNTGAGILVDGGANVTVNNGASPAIRNNFVGIDVNGGTANITGVALNNNTTAVRVMGGGNATLTSNTFNGNSVGLVAQNGSATFTNGHHIDGIAVGNGGLVTVNTGGSNLIVTTSLTITGSGKLDVNDNDMIVDYSGASQRAAIQALINSARSGGTWTGSGLTSTAAKNRVPQNTTLGVLEATEYKSLYGAGATFNGESIDNTAILIKYTYYGDTDFNGVVNFDDYSRTDNGFSTGKSGWLNGDFDGNGIVNFDDYSLIDLAFNTQSGSLRPGEASPRQGGKPGSKPAALPNLN